MYGNAGVLSSQRWSAVSLCLVAAVLAAIVAPVSAADSGWNVSSTDPVQSGPPLAWAPGSLLVSAGTGNQILSYDPLTFASRGAAASAGPLAYPNGLIVGPDGNLYVVQEDGDNILRYNGRTGEYIGVFASGAPLDYMIGGTFGPDGNLYVCSYEKQGVLKINGTTGAYMGTITHATATEFRPIAAAFGPDGDLYVTNLWEGEILKFDGATGAYKSVFAQDLYTPTALVFAPNGYIYIAERDAAYLTGLDAQGRIVGWLSCNARLGKPENLLIGPDGDLYVSSNSMFRVCRYDIAEHSSAISYLSTVVPSATGMTATRGLAFLPVPEPATAVWLAAAGLLALRRGPRRSAHRSPAL